MDSFDIEDGYVVSFNSPTVGSNGVGANVTVASHHRYVISRHKRHTCWTYYIVFSASLIHYHISFISAIQGVPIISTVST